MSRGLLCVTLAVAAGVVALAQGPRPEVRTARE